MPRVGTTIFDAGVTECPKCHRAAGERHVATTKPPTMAKMEKWVSDGIAKATDGCRVEPDGECSHGHTSWIRVAGYI